MVAELQALENAGAGRARGARKGHLLPMTKPRDDNKGHHLRDILFIKWKWWIRMQKNCIVSPARGEL